MYNTYIRNMDVEEKKRILAAKKVFTVVHTKSVNKLEKMISDNPEHKDKVVIALFAHFHRQTKLNVLKHPNLIKLADEFRDAVVRARKNDPFYEFYLKMENASQYKKKSKEFKKEVAKLIDETLKESNTSIKTLSEVTGIKYANLYNFLENEKYTDISVKNAHLALMKSISIREGWESKDEAILEMLKKWEKLKEYIDDKEKENE